MATSTTTPAPVSFQNELGYDLMVYDSFNPRDGATTSTPNYLGTLTELGKVPAHSTGTSIQPLHPLSVFVVSNATTGAPTAG